MSPVSVLLFHERARKTGPGGRKSRGWILFAQLCKLQVFKEDGARKCQLTNISALHADLNLKNFRVLPTSHCRYAQSARAKCNGKYRVAPGSYLREAVFTLRIIKKVKPALRLHRRRNHPRMTKRKQKLPEDYEILKKE